MTKIERIRKFQRSPMTIGLERMQRLDNIIRQEKRKRKIMTKSQFRNRLLETFKNAN